MSALVEPAVLRWARESVNLTPLAASRKLHLPDNRVEEWERGEVSPTVAQLRKAAEVYKRPLAVFFLAEPPADFDTLRDFRRHAGTLRETWSPDLHGEYRRAHAQREYALELAEIEDYPPSTAWRLATLPEDDESIGTAARAELLRRGPLVLPAGAGGKYDHLNTWVSALEEAGVLVLATAGGRVKTSEMRAFSLYYEILPVIVVNGTDGPRGRLFSLLHEYAHLLLHTGGLCDAVSDTKPTTANRMLEARCNAIAAAALMPVAQVVANYEEIARYGDPESWDYPTLQQAAASFGTSAEAFLRRLATLGLIGRSSYDRRRQEFLDAYEQDNQQKSGGGNWYYNTARDLGKGYVRQVADAHRRRVIDSYTAATFLNVKVGQIDRLAKAAALTGSE